MGSMFNSGYRGSIGSHLGGLSADVASQAKEGPGLALEAANHLGHRGDALFTAAHNAFGSGMQTAMYVGAVLLAAGAAFVWFHGPSHRQAVTEDVLDFDDADAAEDFDAALAD
jgi:hypothetical protein